MIIVTSLLFAATVNFAYWRGEENARKALQKELVRSGHAEYYLDENHERQWRMKEVK